MFSPRPFLDAQKRKRQWQELKKASNLLTRVDDFELRLHKMEQEIDEALDSIDEISREQKNRLYDTQGRRPPPPEKG